MSTNMYEVYMANSPHNRFVAASHGHKYRKSGHTSMDLIVVSIPADLEGHDGQVLYDIAMQHYGYDT